MKLSYIADSNSIPVPQTMDYPDMYRGFATAPATWATASMRQTRVAYRYPYRDPEDQYGAGEPGKVSDMPYTSATPAPPHSGVEPYKDFASAIDIYSGDPQASEDILVDPSSIQYGTETDFYNLYDESPSDTT